MGLGSRASLSHKELTYGSVGVTLREGFPGYQRSVCLGTGATPWAFASTEILRWGVKTRSGFTVEGEDGPVVAGRRYWLIAHIGPLRLREPVQVVEVVDEADRKGFAYGTLTGHPVKGEEMFLVDRRADSSVWLTIRSVTQPAAGPWRAAYPLALAAQRLYRRRYFRSLGVY